MKAVWAEAVKEFLRVCLLAAIPVIIDGLSQNQLDVRLVLITAAIAGLRFLDKLLHEAGKSTGREGLAKGLTRF